MATLSSSSSIQEIHAEYADTASYAEDGDADKCKRFMTACRLLILKTPKRTGSRATSETEYTPELFMQQLQEAKTWLEQSGLMPRPSESSGGESTRPRRTYASFRDFRDVL